MFDVEKLLSILISIGDGSKSYVNTPRRVTDSGEYFKQIWISRYNKIKAKSELLQQSIVDGPDVNDILVYLQEKNMIAPLNIEDADYKGTHLFLLPAAIELVDLLENYEDININLDALESYIVESNNRFIHRAIEETINRIQDPLIESETMSAKSAIFCWFLLLTGAISRDNAFVLRVKDEDKEFDLQKEIVEQLDVLAKFIYPYSYGAKRSGKPFKSGDLSNFVRRNKDIRTSFGEVFHADGSYFFFDIIDDNAEVSKETFERVINITVRRLLHFATEQDNIVDTLTKSITWYRVDCPIKQAHRTTLFLNKPSDEYYPMLEHLIYEYILLDE